tara:strand:+ start:50 stop:523 length:474 start_codon:yes stop_codon:yes gene_type:complete
MINKNSIEAITVNITEIEKIQSLLLKTNYELNEIWTPDEGNEVQVWTNKELKKVINVNITEENPIEDNTTKVINELIDLWIELRAIRNAVEYNDDDYAYKIVNVPSAYEIYYSKVKEFEEEWNDDDNHLKKIFKDNIDPSVLAFLDLDENDKLLLTN